jgi:hypothetical protein
MFFRKIESSLQDWKRRPKRKPLVLRGPRQSGKTTVVRKLADEFDVFIELNLEKDEDRKIFSEVRNTKAVVQSIESHSNRRVIPGRTLLFIDEIQNSTQAVKQLRFFHEEAPDLHVIAAGSLLEVRMKTEGWSFPVGRVEFLYIYPASFDEFLRARGEDVALETLIDLRLGRKLPHPVHARLTDLLLDYMVVGGMPEAVAAFAASGSFTEAARCHQSLQSSFKEDFGKYSKETAVDRLRAVWDRIPFEAGGRITYARLAGPEVRSREVSAAFDVLHDAMLAERVFPTTSTRPPLAAKPKAAPKAQFLDVGLCAHALRLTKDHLREKVLSSGFSGGLAELLVGQELLAADPLRRGPLFFWVREEKGAVAELDFLVQSGERILPVEVKAGSHGSLKSLHQFLRRGGGDLGIRVHDGPLRLERHSVALPGGKTLDYRLLSLPPYLAFRLAELGQSA